MHTSKSHKEPTLTQWIVTAAVFIGVILSTLGLLVGHKLLTIETLTEETQKVTIPQVVKQQERALATESLAKYGTQIIVARTTQERKDIVQRTELTARLLEDRAEANEKELVARAIQGIRAAEKSATKQSDLDVKIIAELRRAEQTIKELKGNLTAVLEDSGADLDSEIERIASLDSAGKSVV